MYKEKFQSVLGENEEIIRVEKTRKATFFCKKVVSAIITICIILGFLYFIKYLSSMNFLNYNPVLGRYLKIGFAVIFLLDIMVSLKNCSNYFVCLTNKRIIIRYGTFTNNYDQYSIDNVTGNIQTYCRQSIWDKKEGEDASGTIIADIELMPVGHDKITVSTKYSIEKAYGLAKEIEKVVKSNAKQTEKIIEE